MGSIKTPPSIVPSPSPDVPLAPSPAWTSSTRGRPSPTIASSSVAWTGRSMSNSLTRSRRERISTLITMGRISRSCPSRFTMEIRNCSVNWWRRLRRNWRSLIKAQGQTTWKRPEVARGLESDECYFFGVDKLAVVAGARARRSKRIADYPNPDLGIESTSHLRTLTSQGIYAALKVSEVWRFDGEREEVIIERLGEDGSFHHVEGSAALGDSCQGGPAVGGRRGLKRRVRLGPPAGLGSG